VSIPAWPAEEERYAYTRKLLVRLVPPPADLIELGAAPGAQSIALARLGYRVTAVDLGEASDAWGEQPKGTMARAFVEEGVDFIRWDLAQAPYPVEDQSFDVVLLTEVVEHLRDYPLQALTEARRLLRSRGVLLLTTPNAASPQNRVRLALGRSVYTPLSDWIFGLPHARHAREYTAAELRELTTRAGFGIVRVEGRHLHIHSGRRGPVATPAKRLIDRIARQRCSLGANLVVIGRLD